MFSIGRLANWKSLTAIAVSGALWATLGFAASVPQAISLGGELFLPDGTPITSPNVNFRVQVFDSAETCVLYSENHLAVNLRESAGRFNLILGAGSGVVNNVSGAAILDERVFANPGVVPVANCSQSSVALMAGQQRQIRISYDIGSGFVALAPDVPLVSSAYAMVADSVQGKEAADFLQVVDNGTTVLNQTNAEYTFSSVNWPRLKALLDGTSAQYLPTTPTAPVDLHGQRLVGVADPTAAQDAVTKNYADTMIAGRAVDVSAVGPMTGNNSTLLWDATANRWVAGTLDTSPTGTAGGDLTGIYPSPTIRNDAVTAAKIASTGGGVNRLLITDATTGATVGYGVCATNEVYAWTATGWACTSVATLSAVTSVNGHTGAVTLTAGDITGFGTAALYDWGTGANQIPRLDGTGRLPAVDGSQLYNVNATQLQTRPVASAAPAPGQVLGFNGTAWLPVNQLSGSVFNVTNGTGLLGGPITSTGTLSVDVGTTANKIVQLDASARLPAIDGSALVNVNATRLATRAVSSASPGAGQVLGYNVTTTQWEPTLASTGSVQNIGSGVGLIGGPITSTGTLNVDVGTTANKILQLNAFASIPAVDGSLLYNVNASRLATRALSSTPPLAGQALGWNQTSSVWEPIDVGTGSGSVLQVNSGVGLTGGPITSTGTLDVDVGTAASKIVQLNANAQSALASGGAGAPTYSFASSPTTGVFSPGADQLALATAGTARLSVLANGNIGVNTATPSVALDVFGDISVNDTAGSARALTFYRGGSSRGSINTNSTSFNINSLNGADINLTSTGGVTIKGATGFVGVNTTLPAAGFDIATTGTNGSAVIIPRDSTTNRPSAPVNGMLRYNNTLNAMEGYINNAWSTLSAGSSAGSVTNIASGNGLLGGPITTSGTLAVDVGTAPSQIVQLNANAQTALASGTVSAPTFSFAGNTTTGLYSPGTGQLALATAGTARLSIIANGNVGIGTAVPAQALDVIGSARFGSIIIASSAVIEKESGLNNLVTRLANNGDFSIWSASNAKLFTVSQGGNVGIGTNLPQSILDVVGTGTASSAIIVPRDSTTNRPSTPVNGMLRYNNTINAMEGYINNAWSTLSAGSSAGSVTNIASGNGLLGGPITTSGTLAVDTGTAASKIVQLNATAQTALGAGSAAAPTYSFDSNTNTGVYSPGAGQLALATSGTGRLFVAANGNLGIGAPSTMNDLAFSPIAGAGRRIGIETAAPGAGGEYLTIRGGNAGVGADLAGGPLYLASGSSYGSAQSNLYFQTATPGTSGGGFNSVTTKMTLNGSGQLGIGTIMPASGMLLHTAGNILADVTGGGMMTPLYVQNSHTGPFADKGAGMRIRVATGIDIGVMGAATTNVAGTDSYLSFSNRTAGTLSEKLRVDNLGNMGIGTIAPQAGLDIALTGTASSAIIVPRDSTTNRPSTPVNGMLRYNNTLNAMEGYINNAWSTLSSGSSAGSVTNIASGTGLLGGPITTTGTLAVDVGSAASKIVQENANAQIAQLLGTATLPAYSFAGNTNTGLYSPGANQLALVTSGSAALNVAANGYVGIGTSNPTTNLAIVGSAPAADVSFGMRNLSSTGTTKYIFNNDSTGYTGVEMYGSNHANANLRNAALYTTSNDLYYMTNSSVQNGGTGKITFMTGGWDTSTQIRAVIDATGKLGVGTTTPQAALDVYAVGTAASAIIVPRDSTTNRPSVPVNGMLRYNNTLNAMEGYINNAWSTLSSGSSAGTVTNVASGTGLLGGPITTNGTLAVDVGSAASKIVQENANAQIAQLAGTVSLPSYSFVNSTNTGLFSPAANEVAITTSGTAALRVSASGYVGIGSSTPETLLDVFSTGATAATNLTSSGGAGNAIAYINSFGTGVPFIQMNQAGGTRTSATATPAFNNVGNLQMQGYGTTRNVGGIMLIGSSEATFTDTSAPTAMRFLTTAPSQINASERLRITGAGLIGVGTVNPLAVLDVYATGDSSAMIVPRDSTTNRPTSPVNGMLRYNNTLNAMEGYINNAWSTLSAGSSAGTVTNVASGTGLLGGPITTYGTLGVDVGTAASKIVQLNANAQSALASGGVASPTYSFVDSTSTGMYSPGADQLTLSSSGTARLNILATGEVGIGTSAPTYALDVAGTFRSSIPGLSGVELLHSSVGTSSLRALAGNALLLGSNGVDRVSVASNGNFGVAILNPVERLSVLSSNNSPSTTIIAARSQNQAQGVGIGYGAVRQLGTSGNLGIDAAGTGYVLLASSNTGSVGIGTTTPRAALDVYTNGSAPSAIIVPRDTTTNRPTTPINGMIRYNTTLAALEGYVNSTWSTFPTGSVNIDVGTASSKIIQLNGSAQSALANGTVTAPIYSFANDVNTGIYSPGTGQLAIATAGTARLNILPTGMVGIGTMAASERLSVSSFDNSPSTNIFAIRSANQAAGLGFGYGAIRQLGGNGGLSLDAAGAGHILLASTTSTSVGIGTTTPRAILDVFTNGSSPSAIIVPRDSTANRPTTPINGMIRYNNTLEVMEGYVNGAWTTFASGSSASGVTNVATGTGLLGGAITSTGTLSVDVGSAALKVVQENANAQIAQTLGTVTLPSYAFAGDLDTGIFSPGANQLSLVTSGTAALKVAANGYVGIGTSSPTTNLAIESNAPVADTSLSLRNTASNGTTKYILNNDSTGYTGVEMYGSAHANTALRNAAVYTTSNDVYFMTNSAVQNGGAGRINFMTGGWDTSTQIRAVIDASGRMGIGTTNPGAPLHVYTTNAIPAVIENATPSGYAQIQYKGTGRQWQAGVGNASEATLGVANKFYVYDASATAVRMAIDTNGSVGIGHSSPQAILDIASNGTAGSAIIVPRDSTTNRPSAPVNGMLRYNNTLNVMEGYVNNAWSTFATGSSAGGLTSLTAGSGLLGGTITTTGTIAVDVGSSASQIVQENANAQIAQTSGSASSPSYSFAGNTNTGVYSPGANRLSLVTNGTNAVNVSSAGYLGVGIDPSYTVHASGSGYQQARFESVDNSTELDVFAYGGVQSTIFLGNARGTKSAPAYLLDGDGAGYIGSSAANASAQAARMMFVASGGDWSATSSPARIVLSTTPVGSTTPQDRLTIRENGNVGIGTVQPGSGTALSVEGQIRTKSGSITTGAVDWSLGNAITTTFDCGSAISFANLRDGASYTLVVTGTGTTTCTFDPATTGDDANTVSYRFNPANAVRNANSHTIYSLMRIGTVVYISWITGF